MLYDKRYYTNILPMAAICSIALDKIGQSSEIMLPNIDSNAQFAHQTEDDMRNSCVTKCLVIRISAAT